MGEHHTVICDQQILVLCKLGTMDSMGYVRREEAELLAIFDAGEDADIPELLLDFSTLWRFPWPDEDVEISYLMDLEPIHEELCENISERDCFRALDFSAELELTEHNCASTNFFIVGERHSAKGRRTIIRCNKCQKPWSLSPLNLALSKRAILALPDEDPVFLLQVAARLKANPDFS